MEKETDKLEKQLNHLGDLLKSGIITEEEYRENKKSIEKKIRTVNRKVYEEQEKKRAITKILQSPKEEPQKKKAPAAHQKLQKDEIKNVENMFDKKNKTNRKDKKEKDGFWSYILLVLLVAVILFGVYKYTDPFVPVSKTVTIYEYSDFYCEHCAALQKTLKDIKNEYGNAVKIYQMQFPNTDLHPMAAIAAEASECANDQKRFIEFHDAMFFGDTKPADMEGFVKIAEDIVGNIELFRNCLETRQKKLEVEEDIAAGKQLGVKATPTLIIEGKLLQGAQPYEVIKAEIDKYLK